MRNYISLNKLIVILLVSVTRVSKLGKSTLFGGTKQARAEINDKRHMKP